MIEGFEIQNEVRFNLLGQGSADFFWKGQIINILGSAGHMVSVTTTHLYNII